jgi:hypothetical protein
MAQEFELISQKLALKKDELDKTLEPVAPTEDDVRTVRREDPRLLYALIAMVGVVALFATLIGITAGRNEPVVTPLASEETDPEIKQRLGLSADFNVPGDLDESGNGYPQHRAKHDHAADESHQIA